jgi:hypothetical protein
VTPIEIGDSVYLYQSDPSPIGTVRAVRKEDLVVGLAGGAEYELPLEVVESVVHHRVVLAAHRLAKDARDALEPGPRPATRPGSETG